MALAGVSWLSVKVALAHYRRATSSGHSLAQSLIPSQPKLSAFTATDAAKGIFGAFVCRRCHLCQLRVS
jgi:hypothetical protein